MPKSRFPEDERDIFWPATLSSGASAEMVQSVKQPENLEQAVRVAEMAGFEEDGLKMQVAVKVDGMQRALVTFYGRWTNHRR